MTEITMGVANIPHDDKLSDGGDDAWFITNSVITAVGVADGVGSWRRKGINAGECARELMTLCRDYFTDNYPVGNPQSALEYALPRLKKAGSTTALIAKLSDEGFLEVSQIGDSDLVVFRGNYIAFQTLPQQHAHNQPFQVGPSEPETASDAQIYSLTVHPQDYIVLGTDGLWDNLYASEVLSILNSADPHLSLRNLAQLIADQAYAASLSSDIWSPFAQRGYESGVITQQDFSKHLGGKPDDITVIVCRVSD